MSSRRGLVASLAVTLVLTAWAASRDEAPSESPPVVSTREAPRRPSPADTRMQPAWPAPPASMSRAEFAPLGAGTVAAWGTPAPAPPPREAAAAKAAPPTPTAPPFPYTLIGRLDDGAQPQALLTGPQRTLAAKAGEVIDGAWRVDDVKPSGLALTWLPGGIRQTLSYPPS